MAISWKMDVGINHVPAYQASGRPFASGTINASNAVKINFPYVTRWVQVINNGSDAVKVGFSEAGVRDDTVMGGGSNYFKVSKLVSNQAGYSQRLELKVSELWLSGSTDVDIVAGLTTIPTDRTTTDTGPSWSGSVGVG
tara:strand:- start:263 stop:679 length:417 start_codon:yes stop_codon:yes gene_type:complete